MNRSADFRLRMLYVLLAVTSAAAALLLLLPIQSSAVPLQPDFSTSTKTASHHYVRPNSLLTYTIAVRNTGVASATAVVTETPPVGTVPVSCAATRGTCQAVTGPIWTGDVASNDVVIITYVVNVWGSTMNWPLINQAQIGATVVVTAESILNPCTYLPAVFRNHPPPADLVPVALAVAPPAPVVGQPTTITLALRNDGAAPAQYFWIDLYIDPITPPTGPNQPWDSLCGQPFPNCYGGAWYVDYPLMPGQTIQLTSQAFLLDYSYWGGYFMTPGTHTLYAFVDSWNQGVGWASVHESDENNNLIGPVTVIVTGTSASSDTLPVYPGLGKVRPGQP